MSKRDFKTTLAAYKSFRWQPDKEVPTSGDGVKDVKILQRLFKRVEKAAKEEKVNLTKEHLL